MTVNAHQIAKLDKTASTNRNNSFTMVDFLEFMISFPLRWKFVPMTVDPMQNSLRIRRKPEK